MNEKFNSQKVIEIYNSIQKEDNHRLKSWEHCFNAFNTINDDGLMSLHLAFYLASWGMYRGSCGLLQKDYKVHIEAIEILRKSKYKKLHCYNKEISKNEISLILDLKKELSIYYAYKRISPTDTLISKIILGTFGCLPAYDQYFIDGLREVQIKGFTINNLSLNNLFDFINNKVNKIKIYDTQKSINNENVYYPIMKLIDMYFWDIGVGLVKK